MKISSGNEAGGEDAARSEETQIEGAIIDKNARIGKNVVIKPFPRGTDIDAELYNVRDGIVVIAKNSTIPHGTVIAPEKGK